MSFIPKDPEQESIDTEILQNILCELRVMSAILNEVHDLEITTEDVENECD